MDIQPIVVITKCDECGNNPPTQVVTIGKDDVHLCDNCISLLKALLAKLV